jgi:hypothetical protein
MVRANYEIEISEQTIVARLIGSFGESLANSFTSELKHKITEISPSPFYLIINIIDFTGATPEAYQIQENFNQWLRNTSLVAKANVIDSQLISNIVGNQMPSRETELFRIFDSESQAFDWFESIEQNKLTGT